MSLPPEIKYKYYEKGARTLFRGEPLTSLTKEELIALLAWKLEQSAPRKTDAERIMELFNR